MKIVVTARALRGLGNIHTYISEDSVARAVEMIARPSRTKQLAVFPLSGRRVPEWDIANVREVIEPPYRIIYRVKAMRSTSPQ